MNPQITELLEQITRLAGYVRHQGEAATAGVPASADHLIYLAEGIRVAAGQLPAAIQAQDTHHQRTTCRNADVLDRADHVAHYISQLRHGTVYNFDATGRISIGAWRTTNHAMCLIEWFYLLPGPKKVDAYINSHDGHAYVRVISGDGRGEEIDAWAAFKSPEACAMVSACSEPSIHLLRRLQIAGAQ